MFINHMIDKLKDFKEMLVIEIEEIMQKGDYGHDNNDFGGLGIRGGKKKKGKAFEHPAAPHSHEDDKNKP